MSRLRPSYGKRRSEKHEKVMKSAILLLLIFYGAAFAGDLAALCADRTAVERVYYNHRTGTKPPFEQTLPAAEIERLVRLDLRKEKILQRVYKIDIDQAELDAEVQRINATSRAPDILKEIKIALGNDPKRFADAVARPIVVERRLREKFDNDTRLHAAQRAQVEQVRKKLLATTETKRRIELLKQDKRATEITWQLSVVTGTNGPGPTQPASPMPATTASSANYSVEATTQLAAPAPKIDKNYFEDIDPELQKVLRAQLQKPGDVSAVIETPTAFLLFVAQDTTADALSVVSRTVAKRSYEDWLAREKP